jgi:hypothetical protein
MMVRAGMLGAVTYRCDDNLAGMWRLGRLPASFFTSVSHHPTLAIFTDPTVAAAPFYSRVTACTRSPRRRCGSFSADPCRNRNPSRCSLAPDLAVCRRLAVLATHQTMKQFSIHSFV